MYAHLYGYLFSLFLKMKKFYSIIAALVFSFVGGGIFALTTLAEQVECNDYCQNKIRAEGFQAGLSEAWLILDRASNEAKEELHNTAEKSREAFGQAEK